MHVSQDAALRATRRTYDELAVAARAVPPDRLLWRPAGLGPHVLHILAHCAASNLFLAAALSGQAIPYRSQEEWDRAVQGCQTLEQAEAFLTGSVAAVTDAIGGVDEARLTDPMVMPWGERVPLALGLLSPSYHMQYHTGQINYVQALLGDDEHH